MHPYERHAHNWRVPKAMRLETERKEKNVDSIRSKSQPRNWAEFNHEFICRQRGGMGRGEERGNGMVGVAKVVLSSFSECSFLLYSGGDKSYPGFYFTALESHPFLDREFENWLVAGWKQIQFGV